MTECPEAKCVPANSSQSSGFIEFSDEASHVLSGPIWIDGGLHLIMPHQEGGDCALVALPACSSLNLAGVFQHV